MSSARDALERGVYDDSEYIECKQEINERIKQAESEFEAIKIAIDTKKAREVKRLQVIPSVENMIEIYYKLDSPVSCIEFGNF